MSNGPIYLAGKKNKFTFPGLSFDSAAAAVLRLGSGCCSCGVANA